MRHIIFKENPNGIYSVALLIKGTAFNGQELRTNYVEPLVQAGIAEDDVIAFTLKYEDGKASAKTIKEYLGNLLPALDSIGVKNLIVADGAYFKILTGQSKADPHFGYVLPCKIKGFEHINVVLSLNYQQLIYNPALQSKLDLSVHALSSSIAGTYAAIGTDIIHSASYPDNIQDIAKVLIELYKHPRLTCDIEAFSLRFNEAGIGTIAFAWSKHEGVAFACDYEETNQGVPQNQLVTPGGNPSAHGKYVPNHEVRKMLRVFFETYQGELIFHNAAYDVKVMIAHLWMDHLLDTDGLLKGLEILTRRFHDTKIIAYLATNSTAGNRLSLKDLAHEFAGNWAVEVTDIRSVPLDELLRYNLIDALSTFYVLEKYYPIMVRDNQLDLYNGLMLGSQRLIIQIELTGMPMSRSKIAEVKAKLLAIQNDCLDKVHNNGVIKTLELLLQDAAWNKDYEDRKAKAKNPGKILPKARERFDDLGFNPNSGPQLQRLLYEVMGLPIIDTTDKGSPATGADTIEKLINHTQQPLYKEVLEALITYGGVTKILSTFIPAFENAISKDGSDIVWLHGSFNLGGTVSGRLSSSDPNMQNIPANSQYGKLIKECFVSTPEWLFGGADFNSLEDYISALTTKDPNKLAVYIDGFDGHCLRAAYYFSEQCPDIDPKDPVSVNSMKKKYPELRQDSKGPTFALTYQGTWHTLVNNLGFPEDKAKSIEKGYHELYKVSDEYIQGRLKQAAEDGYVEVAFGLRVRTPLLKQVVWGAKGMPYEAAAEGRTAGNAMGQSYGLLNNRAAVDFMQKVWASKYRFDIKPVALIHDAIYILIRNDLEVVEWANRELINSMRWQELPEIQHPTVKLGAALDIFYPDWAHPTTLPNDADAATILNTCSPQKEAA
jgi:DNA polymerase-1